MRVYINNINTADLSFNLRHSREGSVSINLLFKSLSATEHLKDFIFIQPVMVTYTYILRV